MSGFSLVIHEGYSRVCIQGNSNINEVVDKETMLFTMIFMKPVNTQEFHCVTIIVKRYLIIVKT